MTFLTPLAALVALVVIVPLVAYALLELRARRVSRVLKLTPPSFRSRPGIPIAIVGSKSPRRAGISKGCQPGTNGPPG